MVRPSWLPLAAVFLAAPAVCAPDWRDAGGALFVERAAERSTVTSDGPGAPRLDPLAQPFAAAVAAAADRHGLDPKLIHALVAVESAYRPRAVSGAGAAGLTQLMPGTAADLGVRDRFDPAANLSGGAEYLARQLLRFRDLKLALAAYNAGPERVARLGRVPPIAETQAYVDTVIECYLALAAGRAVRSSAGCRSAGPSP